MKRIISAFMAAILLVSMFTFGTISASAASASPSFGTAPGSITLYVNDSNNDSRTINIKVFNWASGYTYKAFSSNTSIATVENASVNSKSGVLFTVQAKYLGTTKITVQMCKSGKVIQSKSISVKVTSRTQATPTSLKVISTTGSSIKISYSLSNRNYITGYWIQVSTNPRFTSNVKSYKVTSKNTMTATLSGLSRGTRYYVRIASLSTLNGCYTLSGYTSTSCTTSWAKQSISDKQAGNII